MFLFYPGFNPQTDSGMFDKSSGAIVNTVNCRGTSKNSRGVAGQVFSRFDGVHKSYMDMCKSGKFFPGAVQMLEVDEAGQRRAGSGQWVWNVATKDDWRNPSQLGWVEDILKKIPTAVERTGVKSISLPPLGCGEGGLDWNTQVGPLVTKHLAPLEEKGVVVHVFADDPDKSKGRTRCVPPSKNRKGMPQFWPEGSPRPVVNSANGNWYAGIGARPRSDTNPTGTPPAVMKKMEDIGEGLAKEGWGLRSGAAKGADSAFETGADKARGKKEIYLPRNGFQGRQGDEKTVFAPRNDATQKEAEAIALRLHPAGDQLSGFAKAAMTRNAYQLLGQDIQSPSQVVICYTDKGQEKGGTGQSLRLAKERNIPVINLGEDRWKNRSAQDVVAAAVSISTGKSLDEAYKALPKKENGLER